MALVGSARLGLRTYMSTWMLRSAIRLRDRASQIEVEHPNDWASPHVEECLDAVMTAVQSAALFLEAMVNELFTDASDGHGLTQHGYLVPLADRTVALMGAWWLESGQGFDRTLAKYQLLLAFDEKPQLERGKEPYQSASDLLTLRNAIVHYKPATVYAGVEHALEARLKGRFPANGLLPAGSGPWWPNGALGAGCASWAIASAEALADHLAETLGIVPNYQRILRGTKPPGDLRD